MSNLNKATKAELINMVQAMAEKLTTLQHENQEMREYIGRFYRLADQLVDGDGCAEAKLGFLAKRLLEEKTAVSVSKTKDPLVRLEDAKQPVARAWLGEKLGVVVTGIVYTNKARTNFGIVLPEKEARNAKLATLVRAARAAGYASNYWGSEGMWLAPMKKQE